MEDYTATSTPTIPNKNTPTSTKSKRQTTLGIDMFGHIWLGFQIQEALLIQNGKRELKDSRTNEEFHTLGTPSTEIQNFRSLRHVFPRIRQFFTPLKGRCGPGQHLQLLKFQCTKKFPMTRTLRRVFMSP